jgi:hypothetical protein
VAISIIFKNNFFRVIFWRSGGLVLPDKPNNPNHEKNDFVPVRNIVANFL